MSNEKLWWVGNRVLVRAGDLTWANEIARSKS